jgi:hypothetical protein
MAAVTAIDTQGTQARFGGGFDHYNPAAREGWSIIWRGAERERCIQDENGSVWVWDTRGRAWLPLSAEQEATALRDHNCAMKRLRRALLTVRSLDSEFDAEREAARLALQRISKALVDEWYNQNDGTSIRWADGWFDHPGALYLAVTRDARNFFPEAQRVTFEAKTFSYLVTCAHQDFAAKRRNQPPRLRPEDMMLLQTRVEQPMAEPEAAPADNANFITTLREDLAAAMVHEDKDEADRQLRRRKMVLMGIGSGVLALLLAAATSLVTIS